ncbi:DUF1840 domain-containing protein [Extensimonas vulgaris]|uniref:Uncharacterized protein DUF1840 n=1 Tax=Extensimonas vulgaris TaxID=1031594 RepID=A0A369AM55_9BURK|nr:DUF1840 domain-containing protein [Extensimonas vulgaris]RCX09247.1 uncharacterized protein DUF1840 [Extensimonas vulgaris]TWI37830.1 uncharacterized protein DUF1840 [Extensimonas vulgaris]TXD15861.1 DUF1840 domain-containing protein [Extensimonas vulgaris]
MLYRFKSRATADLIMLEPHARRVLQIIGKEPGVPGILTVEEIPRAIAALEAAVAAEEALIAAQKQAAQEHGESPGEQTEPAEEPIRLRQRVAPLIDMLRRSAAEGREVTWSV